MIAISLQSGSNGNSIYVEDGGVRLLFDAGISGARAKARLAAHGVDIEDVDAVIISHDHADHVRCAGVYARKFKLPVWITEPTLRAAAAKGGPGRIPTVRHFQAGQTLDMGPVRIETIPTPHDGVDGVAFVVEGGSGRLGILTDLGHVFEGLSAIVNSLDAVFLESNYDPEMLRRGPYPRFLKRRIAESGGHISNAEAAALLGGARRLRWACLAHLSEQNNDPDLALRTHRDMIGGALPLFVASRYEASSPFVI